MSFAAKFGGICSKCAGRIAAGASVNYDGKAIRHAPRCPAKGSVTEVAAPAPRKEESVTDATQIMGRAAYKGKSGYLVLWHGPMKEGKLATKLAFRDGTKTFWGNGDVTIEKMYDEPISFARLNRLADEFRGEKAAVKVEQKVNATESIAMTEDRIREIVAAAGSTLIEPPRTASFTRDGKGCERVGALTSWTRRDNTTAHGIVVSVEASYYMSRQDCEDAEDMDRFDETPGWRTPFTAREITEPGAKREAREKREAEVAAQAKVETDARAEHDAAIAAIVAQGFIRIDHGSAKQGEKVTSWTKGSNYSHLHRATAEIDGSDCYSLSYGGYDDYRSSIYVMPETRTAIYRDVLAQRIAKESWTADQARAHYTEQAAKYGGCVGGDFLRWAVTATAREVAA